jgi:hypothetical protein
MNRQVFGPRIERPGATSKTRMLVIGNVCAAAARSPLGGRLDDLTFTPEAHRNKGPEWAGTGRTTPHETTAESL